MRLVARLDKFVFDPLHVNLFELRAVQRQLIGVSRSVRVTVVTRIAARKLDELPSFGPQTFRGCIQHEETLVQLEQRHNSIRCRHGQRNRPCHPVHGDGGAWCALNAQEGGNCQRANRHREAKGVE